MSKWPQWIWGMGFQTEVNTSRFLIYSKQPFTNLIRRVCGLETSVLRSCFLQMMWYCWLHQIMSLRPWFCIIKQWILPSSLGVSFCPKQCSISESCSLVMLKWIRNGRLPWWIGASEVLQALYQTIAVKREWSWKTKLPIYRLIYVPTLTQGCELWDSTERIRSQIQAAETSLLKIESLL